MKDGRIARGKRKETSVKISYNSALKCFTPPSGSMTQTMTFVQWQTWSYRQLNMLMNAYPTWRIGRSTLRMKAILSAGSGSSKSLMWFSRIQMARRLGISEQSTDLSRRRPRASMSLMKTKQHRGSTQAGEPSGIFTIRLRGTVPAPLRCLVSRYGVPVLLAQRLSRQVGVKMFCRSSPCRARRNTFIVGPRGLGPRLSYLRDLRTTMPGNTLIAIRTRATAISDLAHLYRSVTTRRKEGGSRSTNR